MIRVSLAALALAGFGSFAQAQVAAQDVVVQVSVSNASTQIFINRATAVPTFLVSATGVDIIESGITEDFTLCVQGTTVGGYKLQHAGYNGTDRGQVLPGVNTGADSVVASLEVASSPTSTSYRTLTNSPSSTTRAYGTACSLVSEPNTYPSRLQIEAPSGTTAITPDTYAGVLTLQVIPQ